MSDNIEETSATNRRELTDRWKKAIFVIALAFAVFQIYTAFAGFLPDVRQRSVHMLFGMALVFLLFSSRKKASAETGIPWWDVLLVAVIGVYNIHVFMIIDRIHLFPLDYTTIDYVLSVIAILISVEGARRVYGWVLPGVLLFFFGLLFVGPYLPGRWSTPGLPLTYLLGQLYASSSGLYGYLTGISATLIAIFIIFGSIILFTGAGDYFMDLAKRLAGKYAGGPAKVAVVASSLFGTISGSAVANVAVTGNYTIPLMKKTGYKPSFAGAVEAVSSSGGMLTPPIMGAGAFILSEITGEPYILICLYAIIPCLLFYTSIFSSVHIEALRLGLAGLPEKDLPRWRQIANPAKFVPLFVPVFFLVFLLISGWSITYAGAVSCFSALGIFLLFSGLSFNELKTRIKQMGVALSKGGIALAELIPLIACVALIIKLMVLCGVTVKVCNLIVAVGETHILLGLFTAALVPFILGMAVPPVAAYVIAAATVAPALTSLGGDMIASHLFLFYIACLGPFTPPVCAAAYVAANIARTGWMRVALTAVRLAFPIYIVPFAMVLSPSLITRGPVAEVITVAITGLIGVSFISVGFFGSFFHGNVANEKIGAVLRALALGGGIMLLLPNWQTDVLGAVCCLVVTLRVLFRSTKGA